MQKPRIAYSPIEKRWYVVTKYREKDGIDATSGKATRYLVATTKHDVTDQMTAILKKTAVDVRRRDRRRPRKGR